VTPHLGLGAKVTQCVAFPVSELPRTDVEHPIGGMGESGEDDTFNSPKGYNRTLKHPCCLVSLPAGAMLRTSLFAIGTRGNAVRITASTFRSNSKSVAARIIVLSNAITHLFFLEGGVALHVNVILHLHDGINVRVALPVEHDDRCDVSKRARFDIIKERKANGLLVKVLTDDPRQVADALDIAREDERTHGTPPF
jgi:hypothetical protein